MTYHYPVVPLGEVASHRKEFITIDDTAEYKRCRVQLHAQGIVERDRVPGVIIRTKEQQLCRANELLVAEIDAKVGGFGIVPPELEGAIVSSHYFLFVPDADRIDPQFLGYFIKTPAFRDQVNARGSTNYAAIRPHHVLEYEIPLPPLTEQRRIVAKIEGLAAKIEDAQGLRRRAQSEADTVLPNEIRRIFDDAPDKDWLQGCLGDYVVDICYGTSERAHDEPVGIPILRMGNIQDGILRPRDLKYIDIREQDRDKWILEPLDVLVNRTNSAELVGKSAVFELGGEYAFASYLIRIRLDLHRADPHLVARYINSPIGREYMFRERKQMTGQANINSKKLKALPLWLPPIEEQRRIVAYLDGLQAKIDRLMALQAQTRAELEALLPSILDRAFRGEL